MKKLFGLLAFMLILPLQACAQEQWKEGEHYEVIAEKATQTRQVQEFFSFWCPHCFRFEGLVKDIQAKLPADVKFDKVHVNFMGFTTPDVQEMATAAMMVGRSMGQEAKLNEAIFKYIHVQRGAISAQKDLKNIFIINGVDGEQFDKLINSFGVKNMVRQNNNQITEFREAVHSVPTFIVNGKYKAQFARGMKPNDFIDLVVWLSQLDN